MRTVKLAVGATLDARWRWPLWRIMPGLVVCAACCTCLGVEASPQPGPHADNPTLSGEHHLFLDLIREGDATNRAVRDGAWSDPATWKEGAVPGGGAVVLIPRGRRVVLGHVSQSALRGVRVDGRLEFAADQDTGLTVDTLIVPPGGELVIGSSERPIVAGRTARITFAGDGPIDIRRDPTLLGRGLISHGSVSIHGASVTPFVALARTPRRGDRTLLLSRAPDHWKAGDTLVLPGTVPGVDEDERVNVEQIAGAEVKVQPLAFDHDSPAADLPVHVANVTRNVVFESQSRAASVERSGNAGRYSVDGRPVKVGSGSKRGNEAGSAGADDGAGHVMFMHSAAVDVEYAAFVGLGRTDKSRIVNDSELDEKGNLIAGTGLNPRGRYALHVHRAGTDAGSKPVRIAGCVVLDSPGWGFVNHSSNVVFEDNVAVGVLGSAFVTEAGDEIGAFRRNLAIRSRGSGEGEDERKQAQDFGHEGDGFWFQGPGVAVEDNIATGQASSGFIFFTQGLRQPGLGTTRFPVANLIDPAWAGHIDPVDPKDPDKVHDPDSVPVIHVPIRGFKGNTAYACQVGFTVRFHRGSPDAGESVLQDSSAWNTLYGAKVRYTANLVLRNLRLNGGFGKNAICGITGTLEGWQEIRYEGLRVEGWPCGIEVPEAGHHVIAGGYWNNARSILIPTPLSRGRHVELIGDMRFGTIDPPRLGKQPQYDIYMDARFAPLLGTSASYRDPNVLFAADVTRLNIADRQNQQIYYPEQASDAVPFGSTAAESPVDRKRFGSPADTLPAELIGKSNRALSEKFGLSIGGCLAPPDAVAAPRIHGLIGSSSTYSIERIPTQTRVEALHGFVPTFISRSTQTGPATDKKQTAPNGPAVELHAGWNLLTRQEDGRPWSILVYGGSVQKAVMKRSKY